MLALHTISASSVASTLPPHWHRSPPCFRATCMYRRFLSDTLLLCCDRLFLACSRASQCKCSMLMHRARHERLCAHA
jgi:hypothetical protein